MTKQEYHQHCLNGNYDLIIFYYYQTQGGYLSNDFNGYRLLLLQWLRVIDIQYSVFVGKVMKYLDNNQQLFT